MYILVLIFVEASSIYTMYSLYLDEIKKLKELRKNLSISMGM